MVDDGLYTRHRVPVPDYVLGQHVVAMRAGSVGSTRGTIMAGADSLRVRLSGVGGHGSQPHPTVDPAVLAAHVVVRWQGVTSREIDPADIAVLTVGSLRGGETENVTADYAEIELDVRKFRPETRKRLLDAIWWVVRAECEASGAPVPPEFTVTGHLPNTVNDEGVMETLEASFLKHFGDRYDRGHTEHHHLRGLLGARHERGKAVCVLALGRYRGRPVASEGEGRASVGGYTGQPYG